MRPLRTTQLNAQSLRNGRPVLRSSWRKLPGSSALTVTAAEWGVTLLTPILAELTHAHPDMPLRLRVENRALDLTRREADLALRIGKPKDTFCALDGELARAPHVRRQAELAREARTVLTTNSMLALVEAVRSGAGLATLPCPLADTHRELRRVLPDLESVQRDVWLVYHRDLRSPRAVRALVDTLVARVRPIFS